MLRKENESFDEVDDLQQKKRSKVQDFGAYPLR